jgi:hypothetical protein
MEYPKDKKSAYLTGYDIITNIDDLIIKGDSAGKWRSDWEQLGKKIPYDYSDNHIRKGMMYTESDQLFRYSLNDKNTFFEDPTYLGFNVKFDKTNSPLWDFGGTPPKGNTTNSAASFIKKYIDIPEVAKREKILSEFLGGLDKIFTGFHETSFKKSYYIESIKGLEKFTEKMIDYKKDRLTITLSEDVSLSSSYLAELYNNLLYSYRNQKYILPDNTLRFDLMIEITDIRIFNILNVSGSSINTNPPKMVYTLHDCNFDFFKSVPFGDEISVAGFSGVDKKHSSLSFDIKYKSISKEFKSALISGSISLHNKLANLVNNKILNVSSHFDSDIKQHTVLKSQQKFSSSESIIPKTIDGNTISNATNSLSATVKNKQDSTIQSIKTKEDEQLQNAKNGAKSKVDDILNSKFAKKGTDKLVNEWLNGIGDKLKQTSLKELGAYEDKLIGRYNDIRGKLLDEMVRQVRVEKVLPRIYPDNVYSADFRTLSLESFAKGLGSSLANDIQGSVVSGILGATNIKK